MRSKRQVVLGMLVIAGSFCVTGCGLKDRVQAYFQKEVRKAAAVQVGDKSYTTEDLDRFFNSRLSEFPDPAGGDKAKSNLLDSFIEDKLLLCQAERLKIEPSKDALASMLDKVMATGTEGNGGQGSGARRDKDLEHDMIETLKIQQYLRDYVLNKITVTDQECEAYYKEHLAEYVRNDSVHVHEILVDDEALVPKIYTLLKANGNKNFADLARLYSKGATASDGGDLGSFQRGELPEEFEKAIFAVSPGTVTRLVRSKYGCHIFMVDEKIPAHQEKFFEVKDDIKETLQVERERARIKEELAALLTKTPVQIHRERLNFNYMSTRFTQ